jgi:integrase
MPLTDLAVRNAKPGPKTIRIKDNRGLYLEISPRGGKWWRLRYTFAGKANMISLGVYPDVSLAEARERRDAARKQIAKGIDPSAVRKAEAQSQAETFEAVAREWFEKFKPTWTPSTAETIIGRIEKDIFPYLGPRPIKEIKPDELRPVIARIADRGAVETARRDLQKCGQIFRYAIATGRAEHNPSGALRGFFPPATKRNFASIRDPKGVGELLRAIEGYRGSHITRCALRFAALTFVRPGELRSAEWAEIDLDAAEWRIPAEKMKMREQHIIPLSRQAQEVLRDILPLTGGGRFVFPSERSKGRCMSEGTILAALRRLGYTKDEMTGHGFRSVASTLLHELSWPSDVIERQLAHGERNKVKASYNFAQHLPERRKMMQAWADYLDALKAGGKVIPLHRTSEV